MEKDMSVADAPMPRTIKARRLRRIALAFQRSRVYRMQYQMKSISAASLWQGAGAAALVLDLGAPPAFFSRTPIPENIGERGFEPCGDFTRDAAAGACPRLVVYGEAAELRRACARAGAASPLFRQALARGAAQADAPDLATDGLESRRFPTGALGSSPPALPPSPVELSDPVLMISNEEVQRLLAISFSAMQPCLGRMAMGGGGGGGGGGTGPSQARGRAPQAQAKPGKPARGEGNRKKMKGAARR
eukprot:tig00020592_g11631.t1